MYEMVIYGVSFDLVGKQPIVLLKTADGNKFLPIWIGHPEAAAILMKLQGASTPRPLTHDLVTDMLGELGVQIVRITVTELKENTFYASITVQQNGSEIEIDSRPSDAIALAVRADAPIFAAEEVIEESAIEFEGEGEEVNEEEVQEIVSEFENLLEHLSQPFGRKGPAVRAAQVLQHPLLTLGVDERHPARLLVALQPRDELQPRVDRLDDRAVVVGDLLSQLPDQRVWLAHLPRSLT